MGPASHYPATHRTAYFAAPLVFPSSRASRKRGEAGREYPRRCKWRCLHAERHGEHQVSQRLQVLTRDLLSHVHKCGHLSFYSYMRHNTKKWSRNRTSEKKAEIFTHPTHPSNNIIHPRADVVTAPCLVIVSSGECCVGCVPTSFFSVLLFRGQV